MNKYGFIYLWHDRKTKRYYIGRHWGTEEDGYISSSNSMREAHRRRPDDFKRRIIKRVYTSQEDLVLEEQRWLDFIRPIECGKRYYNKTLKSNMPTMRGRKHTEETKLKMSETAKCRPKSEETKEKLRQANLGKKYSAETNKKKGQNSRDYSDPVFLSKMSAAAKNRSVETRKKISENAKRLVSEGKILKARFAKSY
jgi:hypothetical protein